jgi:hypothetical protein
MTRAFGRVLFGARATSATLKSPSAAGRNLPICLCALFDELLQRLHVIAISIYW